VREDPYADVVAGPEVSAAQPGPLRRPPRRPPRLVLPVVAVALTVWAAWFFVHQAQSWDVAGLDGRVYRLAARAFLDGTDVYSVRFGTEGLPFTYPPFALLVFVPLALVPADAAALVMFVVSAACLLAVVRWCQDHATGGRSGSWWLTVALAAASSVVVEPNRTTLGLGQVNLLLLALVLGVDARGGRWAGAGAGLATAVKVTPGLLVVAQAVRGDRRAFVRGVLAFLAATGLAAVLTPAATRRYFTSLLWDSARPGALDYLQNQSLRGVLERHLPAHAAAAWLACSLLVLALGAYAVRRHRHDPFHALVIAAVTGLLVSPISWSHHWVWVLPCAAVGARAGWRTAVGWTSALLLAVTVLEVEVWTVGDPAIVVADMYVTAGLAWLVASALAPGPILRNAGAGERP
jgi:alpha-1,2-mannosyltransferase